MVTESTSEALVMYGFPLFWVSIGVIQWFWPSAIFVAFSDETVTPGARYFAVFWLIVGASIGYVFVPWLSSIGGWFIPGFVLLVVGGLQFVHPVWSSPAEAYTEHGTALLFALTGVAMLVFGYL